MTRHPAWLVSAIVVVAVAAWPYITAAVNVIIFVAAGAAIVAPAFIIGGVMIHSRANGLIMIPAVVATLLGTFWVYGQMVNG